MRLLPKINFIVTVVCIVRKYSMLLSSPPFTGKNIAVWIYYGQKAYKWSAFDRQYSDSAGVTLSGIVAEKHKKEKRHR
jgi:hypothetical protein